MKVGIVTFTYGDNYGQRLQNLAVQEAIHQYSDEVYTLRQVPNKKPFKRKIKDSLKAILQDDLSAIHERHRAFEDFDHKYITYYDQPISEHNKYLFPQDEFDFFVAGSDQIWSPFSPDVNSTMFLTFADKKKRIALSPSIAAENIPANQVDKYRDYFNGFAHLSVREERGAELIRDICGRGAEVLIDPTLIHDENFWGKYVKEPKQKPHGRYACCYFLGEPNEGAKIEEICRKHHLERIDMMKQNKYRVMGPGEFLYMIQCASVVITDSYHGCIFSTIFHVPFIMCERQGTKLDMNSRFATLFNKLNINDRSLQDMTINNVLNMEYSLIDKRIGSEREKLKSYLDGILVDN